MNSLLVLPYLISNVVALEHAAEQAVGVFVENKNIETLPKDTRLRLFLISPPHAPRIFDFNNIPSMHERYKAKISIRGHAVWNFFLVSPGSANTTLCTMIGRDRTVLFTDEEIKDITVTLRKGEPGDESKLECIMTPTWNLTKEEGEEHV